MFEKNGDLIRVARFVCSGWGVVSMCLGLGYTLAGDGVIRTQLVGPLLASLCVTAALLGVKVGLDYFESRSSGRC